MRISDWSSDVCSSDLVDANAVGDALAAPLEARDAALADSRFAMELGRWLVAAAGVYPNRIVDRQTSHGEPFLVPARGLVHQTAANGHLDRKRHAKGKSASVRGDLGGRRLL